MIESKNDTSKNLEKALQALKQAQQRVANEKKKQNEKKRKAENHHKYIMGGIIVKYFPDCYRYDEDELNRILSVALQTKECQQIISKIKAEAEKPLPHNLLSPMPKSSRTIYCWSRRRKCSCLPSRNFTAHSTQRTKVRRLKIWRSAVKNANKLA